MNTQDLIALAKDRARGCRDREGFMDGVNWTLRQLDDALSATPEKAEEWRSAAPSDEIEMVCNRDGDKELDASIAFFDKTPIGTRFLVQRIPKADERGSAEPKPIAHVVSDVDGSNKRVSFYSNSALYDTPVWTKLYDHPARDGSEPYPLPDDMYTGSKDWAASNYAGRVEWLHVMYESAKRTIAMLEKSVEQRAEPQWLTDDELTTAYCNTPGLHQFVSAFVAGARFAERHHGIAARTSSGKETK